MVCMVSKTRAPMRTDRAFWIGATVGILPLPLGFAVPVLVPVVDVLMAPGVLLTLPVHNVMPDGWSVLAFITLANGIVYGLAGWGIGRFFWLR